MEIVIFAELALLVLVLGIVLFFMYLPPKTKKIDDNTSNVKIGKQKLKELASDLNNDFISEDDYLIAKQEVSQSLATEIEENNAIENTKKPHILAGVVAIFMIVASYVIYDSVKSEAKTLPKNTIEILENNVKNNPQDSKSWQMLGLSYSLKNNTLKAKNAYEKSYNLGNKDIDLLTEYASVLATLNDGSFAGKPANLVREALEINQESVKALYLAGIIAANANMLDLSKGLWQKALSFSEQGSGDEQMLLGVLKQLDEFQNSNKNRKNDENNQNSQVPTAVQISVVVDIPEKIYKNRADDFIMIYAKNATGRPMPIAIIKEKLSDFNGVVNLTDENSVMPTTKLSDAKEIIVVARISKSGSAIKQTGDSQKSSSVLKNGSQTVELSF